MERLKLGPSKLWTGLVLHHKDVFVTHVIPKLNTTDRFFFSKVNKESRGVLEYAGVNVSGLDWAVHECSSISTLELVWNHMPWGEKFEDGTVRDQAQPQAQPDSLYSPSKRKTDLSYSISESHA